MPPKIHRDLPVDHPPGYAEFIKDLVSFTTERGQVLQRSLLLRCESQPLMNVNMAEPPSIFTLE